ncbi:hypothetical protein BKA62DRAFT_661881 [Auriculariales sp. MPI-PUGE-AT-0066]|nr:hypothetical protein BKA62DRAFT_661881 [Auriculariales sp. MPI-PUGE-AT-0066]
MSISISKAVRTFKPATGPAFEPAEEEYERSVATPNLLYRFARPDLVLQPETYEHVQEIVKEAKERGIHLVIKCGGHSFAGYSTAAKTPEFLNVVSLDLRRMNKARLDSQVDPKAVTMAAGCQWGHVYRLLVNGHHDKKIVNGGRCPFVGTSGLVLGGGLGPFSRSIGMCCDDLKEAKIVTANGDLITVNDSDDPESDKGKLLWALRGAGTGNFGVVVEMTMAVKELSSPTVVAGRYEWLAGTGKADLFELPDDQFLRTMREFYVAAWPNTLTIDSTWMCDLRSSSGNGVRFLSYFDGSKPDFDKIIGEHIQHKDLAAQLKERSLSEPSTQFLHETLVFQWSEETIRAFPENRTFSIYSSFIFDKERTTIDQVTKTIRDEMRIFRSTYNKGERVAFFASFIHSGGSMQGVHPGSAYFWRDAAYHVYLTFEWVDKWMADAMHKSLKKVTTLLRPHSLGNGTASYINFPDRSLGELPNETHEKAYFGDHLEKLRNVKQQWDPNNFFRWPQGISQPRGRGEGIPETIALEESAVVSTGMLVAGFLLSQACTGINTRPRVSRATSTSLPTWTYE